MAIKWNYKRIAVSIKVLDLLSHIEGGYAGATAGSLRVGDLKGQRKALGVAVLDGLVIVRPGAVVNDEPTGDCARLTDKGRSVLHLARNYFCNVERD